VLGLFHLVQGGRALPPWLIFLPAIFLRSPSPGRTFAFRCISALKIVLILKYSFGFSTLASKYQ
jgi:hypothetical protein